MALADQGHNAFLGTQSRPDRAGRETGYTLIELLVVIIVLGLLAAIAVPVYLNQRGKATMTSLRADVRQARTLIEPLLIAGDTIPGACFDAAACAQPGRIVQHLTTPPLDLRLTPGNRIGDFWRAPADASFHICIERWADGQPREWFAIDTRTRPQELDKGTSGGCPWTGVNVR